jgi:hypothetical protein
MSWLYSRALVAEYSAENCSVGAQYALSSASPTPQAFLPQDRMTAFSRPSRFGMTFAPLTDDLGAELLTWFLADSRARTSALPEKAQALTENAAGSGQNSHASFAKFDPVSRSWKTAQRSLHEDWGESSVTWPRSGMTANGQCLELPMLGRCTVERESGSWPTPNTVGYRSDGELAILARTVDNYAEFRAMTSQAAASKRDRFWPTPTAHNAKETNAPSEALRNEPTLAHLVGGHLNPTWVEWLMGWPLGWTDLKPLGTDKSPSAPLRLGDF